MQTQETISVTLVRLLIVYILSHHIYLDVSICKNFEKSFEDECESNVQRCS